MLGNVLAEPSGNLALGCGTLRSDDLHDHLAEEGVLAKQLAGRRVPRDGHKGEMGRVVGAV